LETKQHITILGIESSCDETAAAVFGRAGLRSNVIASQSVHERYGGIVPELASRSHQKTIWGTVEQALNEAGCTPGQIDAVAVTNGPGLMGSLLVGLCFAKGFALRQGIPIIGVNHMDAHIYANFIDDKPDYPFIGLVVSGGHTQIVLVKSPMDHTIIGRTRDDAAGEAFDKIGKVLGLPYPAGPAMDKLARNGDPLFHKFPQALLKEGLDFSFSGLKTSVLYHMEAIDAKQRQEYLDNHINDLCASVNHAITEVLVKKLRKAISIHPVKSIVLAGGVSANRMLREKTTRLAEQMGLNLHIPDPTYCTDNAAMIAVTGYIKAELGLYDSMSLKPYASQA
jgi:N6-L-threonylcarbamoyladenine synthase